MKHLLLFENFGENEDEILFVRYNLYDNSQAKRRLPYEGRQCWAIYRRDLYKYMDGLVLANCDPQHVEYLTPAPTDKLFALNFNDADSWVLDYTDKLPKLEVFDQLKHVHHYVLTTQKQKEDQWYYYKFRMADYTLANPYQIFIQSPKI